MKKDKLMIQNKIDLLIEDMGKSTFLKLLHFIVDVMESDYQIKIFMVRRFLDIFLEFEEIVEYLYDGTIEKKGEFVTNVSMAILNEQLTGKTILVVDDIRLHGRALNEVCALLIEQYNCKKENIVLKVFADNRDTVKVENKYDIKIEIAESVNENRWRKISSSIINSLYILGQPYISHLPYCELKYGTEQADKIIKFIQNGCVEEITTKIQEHYGVRVYLYFMDYAPDNELQKNTPFVMQNLIRIYKYEKLGKILIIPYAFLKPFNYNGILSYYELLYQSKIINRVANSLSMDNWTTNKKK